MSRVILTATRSADDAPQPSPNLGTNVQRVTFPGPAATNSGPTAFSVGTVWDPLGINIREIIFPTLPQGRDELPCRLS